MSVGMNPTILAKSIQTALEKAAKNTTDRSLSTLQPGTGKATYAGSGTAVDLVTLITKSTLIS